MTDRIASTQPWWKLQRPVHRPDTKALLGCTAYPAGWGPTVEWCRQARPRLRGCPTCPHREV